MSSARACRFLRAAHRYRLPLLAVLVVITCCPVDCLAQSLRSTFPGRRVGGGTRGECSARLLAHLVPEGSVYSPGTTSHLGLLEGPTANTVPLEIAFRPMEGSRSNEKANENVSIIELPASTAGITLIKVIKVGSLQFPTVWESSYRCGEADVVSSDPLAFVQTASPPAVSLLISDSEAADVITQQGIENLTPQCGGTVSTEDFAKAFGLDDVIDSSWPAVLPVRCPA